MAFQVDTVFVWVSEVEQAAKWYRRFGIDPGPRFGGWQTMHVDGETRFALHEGVGAKSGSTATVAFRVADLEHEIARLADLEITPVDPSITNTGVARFITFQDPDGNVVQLLERENTTSHA
ncbi:MAG: VOC family protein [Acidimicrobiia bacterium]